MTSNGIITFGEIANQISQRVEPTETDAKIYVGLEHLDPESLRIKRWGTPEDVKGQKLKVRKGQIIFGKRRAYQRKLAVAHFDGICSAHAMVLEAIPEKIIPELLPFLMQSDRFMERAVAISEGSLSPTIKWKALATQRFPLPPKERQREILEVLQAMEESLRATEDAIESAEQLKRIVMAQLLTKGIDHSEFKQTEIGEIPVEWQVKPLGEIMELLSGFAFKSSDFSPTGVQLVRMGNLNQQRFDLSRSPVFLPPKISNSNARYLLQPGDIILSLTGTAGKEDYGFAVEIPADTEPCLLNQRVAKLTPKFGISRRFFLHLLHSRIFLNRVYTLATGTKQANLLTKQLTSIQLPIPSEDEQVQIANQFDQVDTTLKMLESERDGLIESKSGVLAVFLN